MSLNKYDLNAHRRAKRIRALKIDFLIVAFALTAIILITREHPQPRPGAPAFHAQKQSTPQMGESTTKAIVATAAR